MPRKASSSRVRAAPPPSVVPTKYPGKKEDGTGMEEAAWTACRNMLDVVYKSKDGGHRMSDIFRELPDRDEYEDYYETIPEPECLDNIAAGLGEQKYHTPEEFFKQLHLVFLNAKHYNEDESQVWLDAKTFEDQIYETWKARVADGTFAFADPYHKGSRGRKVAKHDGKADRASATPAPGTPAATTATVPPVTIHLRVPRPEPAAPAAEPPKRERRGSKPTTTSPQAVKATSPVKTAPPARPTRAAAAAAVAAAEPPPTSNTELNAADQAVVAKTDASLPRWEGAKSVLPGDPAPGGVLGSGWWGEGAADYELSVGGSANWKKRIAAVAEAIAAYKEKDTPLADVFAQIPPTANIPYLSSSAPSPSFAAILESARANKYSTLAAFDADMSRLFEKARRWFAAHLEQYGQVLTIQRLYNAITAPYPMPLPQNGVPAASATRFASLPAGPGRARLVQDAAGKPEGNGYLFTGIRSDAKDRVFTEEARHKGIAYRIGDFVHLINPDDPSRPIVGQIFKTFVPAMGCLTHHVTVCWYYRPEQTVHPADQSFLEREVFKTGYFCDHPVEDIIERVAVQPGESAARGRPRAPAFYPGWPLYVCNSRYIDKACLFMKIKRWSNVVPEALRHLDLTTVVPFDRPIHIPSTRSPYLLGIRGTGQLGRPKRQPMPVDTEEEEAAAVNTSSRRPSAVDPRTKQTTPSAATPQRYPHPGQQPTPQHSGSSRQTPQAAHGAVAHPQAGQQRHPQQQQGWQRPPNAQQQQLLQSRTFAAVMGGAQVLEQVAVREYLPAETARLFEQDMRHQVLWFSGPPLPQGAVEIPVPVPHSLEYLAYLAKRKGGESVEDARPNKRFRATVDVKNEAKEEAAAQSNGEADEEGDLTRHWWAQGQTEEQILAGLRSVTEA